MGKILDIIVGFLIKGKARQLTTRINNDPRLKKANEELDGAKKNLHEQLAIWEKNRKENNY